MIRKTFIIITNIALAVLIVLGSFPVRAAAHGFNTKSPTQKRKRDIDAIWESGELKKKERIVVRPLPPPQPKPAVRPRSKSNTR